MLYQDIMGIHVEFDYRLSTAEILDYVRGIVAKEGENVRKIVICVDDTDTEYVTCRIEYGKPDNYKTFKRSSYYEREWV